MRLSLATKISTTIVGVLLLALLSSTVAIISAHRFEKLQSILVNDNLASVRAAEELEIALLEQRGYVASYILDDGNPALLQPLRSREQAFDDWLDIARSTARSNAERELLDKLQVVQDDYANKRNEVVKLYDSGEKERAKHVLLRDVSALYHQSYELCEAFIAANEELVERASARVRRQVEQVSFLVTVCWPSRSPWDPRCCGRSFGE